MALLVTILIVFAATGNADQLLRVQLRERSQASEFQRMANAENLDIWKMNESSANVRVPDTMVEKIKANYSTEVILQDVYRAARDAVKENNLIKNVTEWFRGDEYAINTYYHNFDEIVEWLNHLQSSNDHVQVRDVGLTYENRMMKVIRIAADNSTEGNKPAIFLTGGIHAREWLSPATINYMIYQIIRLRNSGNQRITNILKKFDFYFMPVTNPDGYAYTFNGDRLWRKTRKPSGFYGLCIGSDPNRNFNVEFGQNGAEPFACSDIYPGPHAFSENCTRNLRDFAYTLSGRLTLYYDVHTYSQLYLVPFAYNSTVRPENDAELRRVGLLARAAIEEVNGRQYEFGTVGELLYDASGSAMDWFLLNVPANYSYTLELYPTIDDTDGFIVPPSAIPRSGVEVLHGVLTAAESINV